MRDGATTVGRMPTPRGRVRESAALDRSRDLVKAAVGFKSLTVKEE